MRGRKLVQFAKEVIDEDSVELPPGDNLGAGGLDRSLFSHLQKNWTRLVSKSFVTAVQVKRSVFYCFITSSFFLPVMFHTEN